MNPCDRVDSFLSAYLESETSPAETRFLEGHLTACSRCRSQLEGLRRTLGALASLPRVETSPEFTARVLAEVRGLGAAGLEEPVVAIHSRRRAWWDLPPVAAVPLAAAAALAVVLLGTGPLSRTPAGLTAGRGPAVQASDLKAEIAARTAADRTAEAPESELMAAKSTTPPPVASLPDLHPGLAGEAAGAVESLGMAADSYALEDWMLREPAGGGDPVLTRVGGTPPARWW